jgi:hypothetical protein
MDVRKFCLVLAIGISASHHAFSAEKPVFVPTDDEAKYSILSVEISGSIRIAIIKKTSRYSVDYLRSDYDCAHMTSQILAAGPTLESLSDPVPGIEIIPMSRGRVSQFIGPAVCGYKETPG